ncbi:type VI secretion system-associated FHA domain protein TagH [Paracidovorax sp. MALMAid1276]|uniref:type VI secretion system-associated FHA domain protein TagH n=1 Tax=Paracidovorax sp. MALMAid1276 TaxID=3411631 RepID=UPI003B9D1891
MPETLHAASAPRARHPDRQEFASAQQMEKIELVVIHHAGQAAGHQGSAVFGMAGGTIGRSGQNKLVLPDTEAEVARVHAMVRLDSDQAYLANLCERRSVRVNGNEVLSGQEVPLCHGAEVVIGPYRLLATVPGASPGTAPTIAATQPPPARDDGVVAEVPPLLHEPRSAHQHAVEVPESLGLAALPNPWADIPPIVGGEHAIPELAELAELAQAPSSVNGSDPHLEDGNPFAMLGRIEALPPDAETRVAAPLAPPMATSADRNPVAATGDRMQALDAEAPALSNPAIAQAVAQEPVAHRAMVIPEDFDPFAADPREAANHRDAWSGDLPAKTLAEVAQLKNDELLRSLPRTSEFAGEMDNAAHTGLPPQLDPRVELNPLKLFREPGESMYKETLDHGQTRGSDLAQVFSMPRGATATAEPSAASREGGRTETTPDGAPRTSHTAQQATAAVAQAAGLEAMQGLDLDLFGSSTQTAGPANLSCQGLESVTRPPSGQPNTFLAQPAPDAPPAPSPLGIDAVSPPPAPSSTRDAHVRSPAPASLAAPHGVDAGDAQGLAEAFLEGAGLAQGRATLTINPEFMRGFGEALRIAVQGSIDLLSARSEIKREFRADVTVIASGKNNPLKFLPTAEGVMLQLVGQNFPGFMPPAAALEEAYSDLAVHQIALMAGIRAAYAEAVTSLSPAELEKQAAGSAGLLTRLSSLHRKAALWDEYQQRYESIRQHAQDDLMAFSGQTFVQAYEQAAQAARPTGGMP